MKKKKFYITTSIAYVNAAPHVGFALELAQADALARYHRALGEEVFFLTGADEHGQKQYATAKKLGKEPKEWADENAAKFQKLTKDLNISNDDFIRTTDQTRHWPAVSKLWKELDKKGDIYKKKYVGFYCEGCERFMTEKELQDGNCPIHKQAPKHLEEENWFFALSKYSDKIGELIEKDEIKIIPRSRKKEILNVIKKEGLQDISFSRPKSVLPWGIPVPNDPEQVVYVWCDALTNYLSAVDYGVESWKLEVGGCASFWPADVHCIGKDILRFHAGYWPGMLLSAGLPLPKAIFVHGFITSFGQKMSKSLGNVIDPFQYIEKYGADALRYYLLRKISSTGDGDFTREKFEEVYKSDLANDLGNLVLRVVTLAEKVDYGKLLHRSDPTAVGSFESKSNFLSFEQSRELKKILDNFQFDRALDIIWQDISKMNQEIDRVKLWELVKTDKPKAKKILEDLVYRLLVTGYWLRIFLPETAKQIEKILTTGRKEILFPKL